MDEGFEFDKNGFIVGGRQAVIVGDVIHQSSTVSYPCISIKTGHPVHEWSVNTIKIIEGGEDIRVGGVGVVTIITSESRRRWATGAWNAGI